jgi:hypothetical protein
LCEALELRAERAEAALTSKLIAWANNESQELCNQALEEAAQVADSFPETNCDGQRAATLICALKSGGTP